MSKRKTVNSPPLSATNYAAAATPAYKPVFQTQYLGGLDPIYSADMSKHIGKMLNTNPWDLMSRNQQIESVSGKPVQDTIVTHGGQAYPRDTAHIAQGIGGASNEGIAKRVQGRFDIASQEGIDLGGTGEVLASPHTMTDSSVNFAMPVTDLYRSFFNRLATPEQFQQLTDELRSKIITTKNNKTGEVTVKKPYADIPNLDDPAIDRWFSDVPEFRKEFLSRMQNTKKWSEMVGLNPKDVLAAFRDENLIGVPPQYMGHTLIEAVPGAPIQPSKNATYSHDTLGGYRGSAENTPVPIMLNKPFSEVAQEIRAKWPDAPREDVAKWATGALGSREKGISEMITPEMLRRIEDYHVGLKQDKFPPNDIGAALDYLDLPKFADGGMVDSVPEEAIKNTVRDPQAARLLDLDLAKYALINQQPQRMMGGGAMKKIAKGAIKPVLSQAEKDANLAKFLENAAVQQRMYHATTKDFDQFDTTKKALMGEGSWFSKEPSNQFAEGEGGNIMPVHLSMKNPKIIEAPIDSFNKQNLINEGFDGVVVTSPIDGSITTAVAFEPTQVKSAIGNRGTYDPNEPSITKAHGGVVHMAQGGQVLAEAIGGQVQTPIQGDMGKMTFEDYRKSIGMHEGGRHMANGGPVHMNGGGRPPLRSLDEVPSDEYIKAELDRAKNAPTVRANSPEETANYARYVAERASRPLTMPNEEFNFGGRSMPGNSGIDINRDYSPFSVLEKPTYGSEVPGGFPSIDQQRYELTMKGQQEERNRRYRAQQGDALAGVDPTGTLAVADAARTLGLGTVALPVHAGRVGLHWLQHGNTKDAPTGKDYEELMSPRTAEGAELLEEAGTIGSRLSGSEMGFGMNPSLWAHAPPTVAQMRAGLKLGAERAAPVLGKIDDAVRSGYESGAIPQPGLSIKDVTPKALAPANEQGFYSPTEAAALNLQRKTGNGQAFLNDLLKPDTVRPEEISNMGLDTWLKDKKNVTAAEVQDYIAQNKLGLGESVYGGKQKGNFLEFLKDKGYPEDEALRILNKAEDGNMDGQVSALRDEYLDLSVKPTKFQGYQLPGGENYREVVLTLPEKPKKQTWEWFDPETQESKSGFGTQQEAYDARPSISAIVSKIETKDSPQSYRSSHFDEPNILAHLRMSDRVTDGKKTLLVDEVQSDWHQAGREQGYKLSPEATAPMDSEYRALVHKNADAVAQGLTPDPKDVARAKMLEEQLMQSDSSKVPNAPYKEDWYQLALRRAVKEAIDGGYDRVALPTGDRVADRFKLSNHVDSMIYAKEADGTYSLSASKGGREVVEKSNLSESELSAFVGKDMAKKIIGNEGKSIGMNEREFTGIDLNVGGEGMRKWYDEIYPGYLKKFGKKYGASIGKTTVDADGVAEPLHYMDITPAMRKEFSTGIHMAKGGKVSFAKSADDMRKELLRNKHG